jgi:hypothetical protein
MSEIWLCKAKYGRDAYGAEWGTIDLLGQTYRR